MQTILTVTGASGFLGGAVCKLARRSGYWVRALVRNAGLTTHADQMVCGALTDPAALQRAFAGSSVVIHCAGRAHIFGSGSNDEAAFKAVNAEGTVAVANAAAAVGVRQLILASSVSVYGGSKGGVCDEMVAPHPVTPYACSKLLSEQLAAQTFEPEGTLTILRLATLYGEGDRGNIVRLIRSIERHRFIWPGNGFNRKSLLYREDAARAVLTCIKHPVSGVFNVSAEPVSMRDIVESICISLQRPVPRVSIPDPLLRAFLASVPSWGPLAQVRGQIGKFLQDDVYSADLFARTFGWRPSVALMEGIQREVKWLQAQYR